MEIVGFVTSIPVEIVFAAGCKPVDLNNVFITAENSSELIILAENYGFPRNYCSWIKGTFQAASSCGIRKIIAVSEGECTNNERMIELLCSQGVESIPFSYPGSRKSDDLCKEIEKLMLAFSVLSEDVHKVKNDLDRIREKLFFIDESSYTDLNVSGFENYIWLISSSDFGGDYYAFEKKLDVFIGELSRREKNIYKNSIKIGLLGIPPITNNLFESIESMGGIIVYNEMPRQFAMPGFKQGLIEQYRNFTYPYGQDIRMQDILAAVKTRQLDGVIHYVQSFCPRQLDDISLRKEIGVPFLTLEGDRPGVLDERNRTRLEAFFERWN